MSVLLVVKALHLLGAAGCVWASAAKNLLLRQSLLDLAAVRQLVRLDKVSGLSAVLIALTGIALARGLAKPAATYGASPLFWAKVALFLAASAAVISTKPALRRALQARTLAPSRRMRLALAFDLVSLLIVLGLGRALALGV